MPQAETVALPKRLPIILNPENRSESTGKDARLVNGYMEKMPSGEYQLYSRPGTLLDSRPPGANAAGYGSFNWLGDVYSVFGTALYKNGTSIGTTDATNGVYRFSSSSGTTPRLVLGNGVKAYTYDGTTFAQITDPDFPTAFYKGWSYLDKTTYVMSTPNKINGSDLDNPTAWDSLNLINAQIAPDKGVGLDKQLVYTVAFKQWTTEVFYDAQNSTGSPMGTVQGAKINFGAASIETVQDIDGSLYWVATNRNSSPQIIRVDNLKPSIISTPAVERILDGADFTACFSWTIKEWGHWFYVLTLKTDNITLAYDTKEGLWSQWTDTDGNYFPIVSSTYNSSGVHILQHETNGKLYLAKGTYVNDDGSLFTVDMYLPNFDGGTRRRKQLNVMTFVGDQTPGSVIQVRGSDDDYQTWSNFRNVYMEKKKPLLTNCGTFEKRAYHLRHRCNARLRLQAIELQMDLGTL